MSNFRSLNSDKQENIGTIGFRFHANEEELEEVLLGQDDAKNPEEYLKPKTEVLTNESLDGAISETVKDQRNLLGKRSISVDSAYESHFSNPIEKWKKLNVLKEKITKTVEEKILEKIDRNVLSKSGRNRLNQSKENSSISDSEDTSESSKLSDQLQNAENQTSSVEKTSTENLETNTNISDTSQDIKNQPETENREIENELRNRKNFTNFSEFNLSEIKIATAKTDEDRSLLSQNDENLTDVESGVEADENLDATEESFDSDNALFSDAGSSNTPPFRGNIMSHYCYRIFTKTSTFALLLGIMFYFLFPLPEFFRGFLLCVLIVLFWEMITYSANSDESIQQPKSFVFPNFKSMPPLKVPKRKAVKGIWFNEYEEENYDPDSYSVTQTVPAYLELENSILKVSRPKGKIRRRATYDEPEYKLPIISERVFNICGCNVYLLPDGLTRKRLFSKKYPIVIFLKPDSLISEKKRGKEIDEKETPEDAGMEEHPCSVNPESPKNKCTLYLFARCDRQKEEWYRKLLSASRLNHNTEKTAEPGESIDKEGEKTSNDDSSSKESCTPFETLFFDNEEAYLEEYAHYMASFVQAKPSRLSSFPEGLEKEQEGFNYSTDQVQWLNAFLNRILFDVFRSPHWHSKIQEKVYRKLNSIRLPYYIENIEVVELDLGKTGPMFHRVSQPYLDECGLWFDMDLTFDGLIKLTIQTHLNLIKLQKGVEDTEESTTATTEKPKKEKQSRKAEKESLFLKEQTPTKARKKSQFESKEQLPKSQVSVNESDKELDPAEKFSNFLIQEVTEFAKASVEHSLKINPKKHVDESANISPRVESSEKRSAIYDSELEDSAESSDEDEEEVEPLPSPVNEESANESFIKRYPKSRRSSKKLFQVFENVARSKYFRSMAQSKYIQKAIAGVSAAKLRLTLEVRSCTGIVAVNIPPPPSDRFWFGFREMPKLVLSANPKIGDKAVRFIHIKNYLQKKILRELKIKLVRPNMITKVFPLLSREKLTPEFFNVPRFPWPFGKKVLVVPNMIDFVLPTSAPALNSSFVQVEEHEDLEETTLSE